MAGSQFSNVRQLYYCHTFPASLRLRYFTIAGV